MSQIRKILVVGDPIIDYYINTNVSRIAPEAAITVNKVESSYVRPGGALNVALNLCTLGASVDLASCFDETSHSIECKHELNQSGVNLSLSTHSDSPIPLKTRFLSSNSIVFRADKEFVPFLSKETAENLFSSLVSRLPAYDAVVLSDYSKGLFMYAEPVKVFLSHCKKGCIPVFVDTKGDYNLYSGVTCLTPNLPEASAYCGFDINPFDRDSLLNAHTFIMRGLKTSLSVITLGKNGASVYNGDELFMSKTRPRQVFDVTGAGDTFLAGFVLGYMTEVSLLSTIKSATSLASQVVQKLGTSVPVPSKVPGFFTEQELGLFLGQKEALGSIVVANGCFDLLHPGHLSILSYAAALGDTLVVLLNSDASVRSLKGESRPLVPEMDRAKMLLGLDCVDYVILFSGDTPVDLIREIRPSYLVKGDEYIGMEVVGQEYADNVAFAPTYADYSTTRLVTRSCV